LLDAAPAIGRRRIANRPADHFEREQDGFFARVRSGYRALAEAEPRRIKTIDASRALADVQSDIAAALEALLVAHGRT
jgi:dTMP kinase